MFRSYALKPQTKHDVLLEFEWDPETGSLRGPGAEIVTSMCQYAINDGYVQGHPYPTTYTVTDPLHKPAEMSVVLGQFWVLDEELQKEYPQLLGEISDSADQLMN